MTALSKDDDGVDVTFKKAAPRRFGWQSEPAGHSMTRRLALGPKSEFVRHTGLYIATMQL